MFDCILELEIKLTPETISRCAKQRFLFTLLILLAPKHYVAASFTYWQKEQIYSIESVLEKFGPIPVHPFESFKAQSFG